MRKKKDQLVRVLGADYRLLFLPGMQDVDLHGDTFGLTSVWDRLIKVDSNACQSQQKDTLLHELVHVADQETAQPSERLTESQVFRIARALFSIMHDNAKLADWIMSEDE